MRAIAPAENQLILSTLQGLPPLGWYWADCRTADQKQHFFDLQAHYQRLRTLLHNYFSEQLDDWSGLSQSEVSSWKMRRAYWTSLYDLIRNGWEAIAAAFAEAGVEVSTPGNLLVLVLEWEAAGLLVECLNLAPLSMTRFSPQKAYNHYKESLKPVKDRAAALRNALSNWEKAKQTDEWLLYAPDAHLNLILKTCHQAAKRDRVVRKSLKAFNSNKEELRDEIYKDFHPRKKARGYQWVNGQKLSLTSS
jgi:hypothetical protein